MASGGVSGGGNIIGYNKSKPDNLSIMIDICECVYDDHLVINTEYCDFTISHVTGVQFRNKR